MRAQVPGSFTKIAVSMAGARQADQLSGRAACCWKTAFGHLMLVSGGDTAIVPHLIRDGFFDRNLTNIIDLLLVTSMTFIAIGANCGTYTIYVAARVGREGRVIAIEAVPAISVLLQETVAMNGAEHWC
jgi:hypothetical protein